MENLDLLENEEKALIGVIYNHLSFSTTMEIFGEISSEGIKRLEIFRGILSKFLKKYSLDDKITEETYLLLGMTEFIKKDSLEKWVQDEDNKHMQLRAKYFINK